MIAYLQNTGYPVTYNDLHITYKSAKYLLDQTNFWDPDLDSQLIRSVGTHTYMIRTYR